MSNIDKKIFEHKPTVDAIIAVLEEHKAEIAATLAAPPNDIFYREALAGITARIKTRATNELIHKFRVMCPDYKKGN